MSLSIFSLLWNCWCLVVHHHPSREFWLSHKTKTLYQPETLSIPSPCPCVCVCTLSHFSHVSLWPLWTVAHQATLSMGFSRQVGMGCRALLQGTFLIQGSNSHLSKFRALAGRFFTVSTSWEAPQPLPTTILLFVSTNLTPLRASYTWNHTVFILLGLAYFI